MSTTASLKHITQKADKSKPASELQKLWQRIEKHQKRNGNFIKKVDENFQQFKLLTLENEKAQAKALCDQICHLTSFLARKSFTEQERIELIDWVYSDLEYLKSHPFIDPGVILELERAVHSQQTSYRQSTGNEVEQSEIDEVRSAFEHEFGGSFPLSDEEIKECILDPNKLTEYLTEYQSKEHEQVDDDSQIPPDEEDFDDNFQYQYQQYHDDVENETNINNKKLDKLFKGSQLNKMYKKLASLLHPDKESDPSKKQDKLILMQSLADAKRDKDGFKILQMYLEYFEDTDFDQHTLESLEPLLANKVRELNMIYRELQNSDDMKTLVWRKFKASSKAMTKKKMNEHTDNLQQECHDIEDFIARCTTVKMLKIILKDRLSRHQFNPFMNLGSLPDFLFD